MDTSWADELLALRQKRRRQLQDLADTDEAIDRLTNQLLRERLIEVLPPFAPYIDLSDYLRELHANIDSPGTRTIAKALGNISHTTVAYMLNGTRRPSWENALTLGTYMGGDPEVLRKLWSRDQTVAGVSRTPPSAD